MSDLRQQLQSTLGATYAFERELGGGGMSRVFVARETALGRRVVVKLLTPELSGSVSVERFRREIQLAAQLQHPHIVPLLSAGEADGMLYYTMPFIEGESLRALLAREGELPIGTAVRVMRDVLRALAHAHRRGVVHRDIKPENVLLGDDGVLVADFGVAKALSASTSGGGITSLGVALGTPAYMAPEQAAADPHVDQRADIYAVGVMAYELLTGQPPFAGRAPQQMLAAQVAERPEPVEARRPSVPPALAALVMRCLEKRPADRPQTADEVLHELDAVATPGALTLTREGTLAAAPSGATVPTPAATTGSRRAWRVGLLGGGIAGAGLVALAVVAMAKKRAPEVVERRVVVATFENKTGDPALAPVGSQAAEHVAQGISELGMVETVDREVALRAERAAGGSDTATASRHAAVAQQTRASTLVAGSYYRVGDSLQFQAQLVDARTGRIIRALDPVRAPVQDPLPALDVVRQRVKGGVAILHDSVFGPWMMPAGQPPAFPVLEAYRAASNTGRADAVRRLEALAAADTGFFLARIGLVYAYLDVGRVDRADSLLQLLQSIGRLTPNDRAELMTARATRAGDMGALLRARRQAVEIGPSRVNYRRLASALLDVNRPREALEVLAKARTAPGTPAYPTEGNFETWAYHLLGEHRKELDAAREARRHAPERLGVLGFELRALAALDSVAQLEERIEELLTLPAEPGQSTLGQLLTRAAEELRAHGHPDAARRTLARAIAWYRTRPPAEARDSLNQAWRLRALYAAGRLDEAQAYAEELSAAQPGNVTYRAYLGRIAARRGDRATARRIFDELAALEQPLLRGSHTWERAHIAAVLGEREEAIMLLRDAFAQGRGRSERILLHSEIDFEGLRAHSSFVRLMQPQG